MPVFVTQVLSHWAHAFPFFNTSADAFYAKLERNIKEHDMPDVKVGRVKNKEGGMFSASREYLQIKYDKYLIFEVCAAPFGKDFFISWWLYEGEGLFSRLMKFTKFGEYLRERAAKQTFFQADEESMFRNCVHNAVLETIEEHTSAHGLRGLSDFEKAIPEQQV